MQIITDWCEAQYKGKRAYLLYQRDECRLFINLETGDPAKSYHVVCYIASRVSHTLTLVHSTVIRRASEFPLITVKQYEISENEILDHLPRILGTQ